ncbi:hypothetical protein ACH5RR_041041 [Cinchona calisaya]|uniref:Reverse transcriptase zinc-binding domain-containing protein n=1 Tax=Cinchona calisaya TaxID=153742 RepID=A0ABD2XVN3_9GENT
MFRPKKNVMRSRMFICSSKIPIKFSNILWQILNGVLPFGDVLVDLGFQLTSKCCFCNSLDSIDHYAVECSLASRIWSEFEHRLGIPRIQVWWVVEASFEIQLVIC